jgi:hypothetical protein
MKTIEDFLIDLQSAALTWTRAKQGDAIYETVYKGEPVKLRLNDFPDEVLFTLFIRDKEINLEERPKTWHLLRER